MSMIQKFLFICHTRPILNESNASNKAYNGKNYHPLLSVGFHWVLCFRYYAIQYVFMLLPHFKCVCVQDLNICKKFSKNIAKISLRSILQIFFLEIFANISILYTHIFSVAKAFTQTKLHSSENKVPSSILHLIVENTISILVIVFSTYSIN